MIDTSGHHIVYGVLTDFLTGEELPDTDDERVRQQLAELLVKQLGYSKDEIEPRKVIISEYNGNRVKTLIELTVAIDNKQLFILRYGPGSLVTREKAAIAAARILNKEYRIPLAIVTNGQDAELLETENGVVLDVGMDCIPDRKRAEELLHEHSFDPYDDDEKREQALRILNIFDEEICCAGTKCEKTDK